MYKVKEFAEKAGVTVRTLHHYDRLGLLKPSGRTDVGYRLYADRDFARLQQIVTLKFIGLPLKEIRTLLDSADLDLQSTLRLQRRLLTEKRRQLEMAILAVELAEREVEAKATVAADVKSDAEGNQAGASRKAPDMAVLRKIIEVMERQNDMEWTKKYYSEEAQAKVEDRGKLWSPELQAKVTQDWQELIKEVEAAMAAGEKPESESVQKLASRWKELVRGFTGGDPEIQKGLNEMYSDRQNWPASAPQMFNLEVQAFMMKAMAAGKE